MPRILWLAFERPPHIDAVCHAATTADVHLVLELLALSEAVRTDIAAKLKRMLAGQVTQDPWSRPAIPCRRSNGLYVLISWRLAKWLSVVLPASTGLIERTAQRLRRWLEHDTTKPVLNATSA
ncbi:MAG TPA: hypothetical protein VFG20_22585 [Planctomycetaceae bacterium]|jgi:hypothetical protein|nr:hypothetical protein [Planctomycetaceae bacterium]